MTTLNFTEKDGMQQSDAILCGDEGIVTFAIKIADGKVHTLLAQHSVDGENWQNAGTMDFVGYAEVNVDGLRPSVQRARIIVLDTAEIDNAQYV